MIQDDLISRLLLNKINMDSGKETYLGEGASIQFNPTRASVQKS